MKTRRHHNNIGLRQIKSGGTTKSLRAIAKRLRLSFENPNLRVEEAGAPARREHERVSTKSLNAGERASHVIGFIALGLIGMILIIWSGSRASEFQKANERAQTELRQDIKSAREKMDQSLLSQENMKGQLSAFAVVLIKFVTSGRQVDLRPLASAMAQVSKAASDPTPTVIPLGEESEGGGGK